MVMEIMIVMVIVTVIVMIMMMTLSPSLWFSSMSVRRIRLTQRIHILTVK
jgi:hypothetical protein